MHFKLKEKGTKFLDVGENAPVYRLVPQEYSEPYEKYHKNLKEIATFDTFGRDVTKEMLERVERSISNRRKLEFFEEWLRETALDKALELHALTFENEKTDRVRRKIRGFCDIHHEVPDDAKKLELWRTGDALSLTAIQLTEVANAEKPEDVKKESETPAEADNEAPKAPEKKAPTTEKEIEFKNLNALLEYALREFVKNIFRRINIYETPLAEGLIAAFRDVSRPAMFPIEATALYEEQKELPTPETFKKYARMIPMFWKSEIQAQVSQMIEKSGADPNQQTLLSAALYQSLKTFFGDDEQFPSDKVEEDLNQADHMRKTKKM